MLYMYIYKYTLSWSDSWSDPCPGWGAPLWEWHLQKTGCFSILPPIETTILGISSEIPLHVHQFSYIFMAYPINTPCVSICFICFSPSTHGSHGLLGPGALPLLGADFEASHRSLQPEAWTAGLYDDISVSYWLWLWWLIMILLMIDYYDDLIMIVLLYIHCTLYT